MIYLYIIKEHSKQQLLQCRSNFFVCHMEHSKQQLLMKIQNEKFLLTMEFSNFLIVEVKILRRLQGYTMGLGVTIIIETNRCGAHLRGSKSNVLTSS
jgi:hypothetical protein